MDVGRRRKSQASQNDKAHDYGKPANDGGLSARPCGIDRRGAARDKFFAEHDPRKLDGRTKRLDRVAESCEAAESSKLMPTKQPVEVGPFSKNWSIVNLFSKNFQYVLFIICQNFHEFSTFVR